MKLLPGQGEMLSGMQLKIKGMQPFLLNDTATGVQSVGPRCPKQMLIDVVNRVLHN